MVTISFENAVCRRSSETKEKYRLALSNGGSEVRSAYHDGRNVFEWERPFQQSVKITTSSPPIRLMIELRSKGFLGFAGHKVASYTLEVLRDCQSTTFDLQNTESDVRSPPRLSVTVTVSGLSASGTESVPQLKDNAIDIHNSVGSGTSEPDRSVPLNQNLVTVETTPHPAQIELPIPHPLPSSSPPTSPPIPVLQFSTPDDREQQTSASPDGVDQSLHEETRGLTRPAPLPPAFRVNNPELLSAESAARKAKDEQSTIRQRSNSITDSISTLEPVASGAGGLRDAMYSGVSRLEAVVQVIDVAANIHPLIKGVWSLLNVAYMLAKQQSDLDIKVGDLVNALDANCELARVLTEDQIAGVAETIVTKILREVLNGADIIKEYCIVRKSKMSAFKFAASTTAIRVETCLQTLEVFRRNLADHVAANVHRDLHGLQTLASTLEIDLKAVKAQMDQVTKYVQNQEDDALLNQMPFAPEADRAMRSDERGCLPGTRAEIIEAIVHWAIGANVGPSQAYIRGLNPNSRVLWLCGVAGSGKSSIAISVARVLRSMGRLGAIYGFEAAFQTSLNPTNLFSTIARQRAEQQLGRKRHLLTTLNSMNRDQRATVSASEQFKSFLLAPVTEDPTILDDVVVIDAFDESAPASKRTAALLALSPESHDPFFPSDSRVIVTSRFDPDIADRLDSALQCDPSIISVLQMEDIRAPDTVRDIEIYVVHMLGNVRGLETSRAAGDLARLAVTAEHSFQWASTSCRYIVDAEDHDGARLPAERLRETLDTRGGLDELYLSILDRSFRLSITHKELDGTRSLRMILGCLVCASEPLTVQTIAALASTDPSLQNVNETSFHILARKLSSIITGTKDTTTPLVAFHTSFTDFLADAQRGKSYAVDAPDMHLHLALASLTVMSKSLRFNICDLETSFLRNNQVPDLAQRVKEHISPELLYACRFWPVHAAFAFSSASVHSGQLRECFSAFLENKLLLLEWLEVMSLTGTDAYESLTPLSAFQTEYRALSDLITFIAYFTVPISASVPHIYLSALAFTPSSSSVTSALADFPNIVQSSVPLVSWPQIRHTFAHQSEVHCVTFSPNGKWVLSGAESGEISVWDVYSGRLILPRMFGSSRVFSVAISADGSLLASGFWDGNIQLWDLGTMSASGEPLQGHTDEVNSVAFSPDGALLASGSDDKTVRLWAVSSRSQVGSPLLGHNGLVLSVAFSPSGDLLASSGRGTIRLWNVQPASATGTPLEGSGSIWPIMFSPNGTLLASGEGDGTVHLWDANTMSALEPPLTAHTSSVRSLSFSPDSKLLASCSDDRTVRVWDMTARSPVGEPLVGHTGDVVSIAFSPDGDLLASGSVDKTVRIWDARVLPSNQESSATQFKIQDFATFSPDGKLVASGSDNHAIQLWDVHSVSTVGEPLKGHTNHIRSVVFSPDGTLLASGSDDKTVRLWDVRAGSAVGEALREHSHSITALAFSPDNKLLASASEDKTIRFWDTHARSASGDALTGHSEPVLSVAFSPDGSTLASGDNGGTVWLWDVQTRSLSGQALQCHSKSVQCLAFSHDGTLLASGSNDCTVCLWDVGTQSAVGEPLKGHTSYVASLAFSPNGMLLASSSWSEGVIRVWDVRVPSEVGEPVALLRHELNVSSIAFLPAAPILVSLTSGGVVRKWDLGSLLSVQTADVYGGLDRHLENDPSSPALLPDHPDLDPLPPDSLANLDDGWVVGPKQELVLWIPPAVRPTLSDLRAIEQFGGSLTKLDFTRFVCGSDWAKCYSPPSASTSHS